LTVSLLKAEGSNTAVAATAVATASDIITAAGDRTEIGLAYTNGPLNIAYANVKFAKYSTEKERSANTLAANYNLGATTLYAGMTSGDLLSDATAGTTQKGANIAVKHTMGKIDLLAGYSKRKDTGTDAQKVTGLRADYNFSKTTATYVGYEAFKGATTAADQKLVSIGLRKSF
jgi:predicted porin